MRESYISAIVGTNVTSKKFRLYVKSEKRAISEHPVTEPHIIKKGAMRGDFRHMEDTYWNTAFETKIEVEYDYFLPHEQKAIADTVEKLCEKHGYEVKVVDVTRENLIHRALQEEVNKITTFPTLIADSGQKLEGDFSEEQIELFLSKS